MLQTLLLWSSLLLVIDPRQRFLRLVNYGSEYVASDLAGDKKKFGGREVGCADQLEALMEYALKGVTDDGIRYFSMEFDDLRVVPLRIKFNLFEEADSIVLYVNLVERPGVQRGQTSRRFNRDLLTIVATVKKIMLLAIRDHHISRRANIRIVAHDVKNSWLASALVNKLGFSCVAKTRDYVFVCPINEVL